MDKIDRHEYEYELPADKIASYPLPERDQSKLLVYQQGNIQHSKFESLPYHLPENSILFFNDTRVIPARMYFEKETGASIEIFLTAPAHTPERLKEALLTTTSAQWHCIIGNLKRWRPGIILTKEVDQGKIFAKLIDREKGVVELSWSPAHLTLAEMLGAGGVTPLPPYIHRQAMPDDRERYQTVYSAAAGAVAAPTAGLHFTDTLMKDLVIKGCICDFLTLHVSAGTFQPVKVENAAEHPIHTEQIIVTEKNIAHWLTPEKKMVAVGTTSLRTMESAYWYGVKLLEDPEATFCVEKFDPYQPRKVVPAREAFQAVAAAMKRKGLAALHGETSIYILPGYSFKVCDALITNFHQPGSTLMLLVAAFVGQAWKKIYQEALANNYRFLSYGDGSLLFQDQG